MLGIATVGAAVAAVAFEWRDLGAPLARWPSRRSPAGYEASRSPLWRIPVVRRLYQRRARLPTWGGGPAPPPLLFAVFSKNPLPPRLANPPPSPSLSAP